MSHVMTEDEDEPHRPCPYCKSTDDCPHLLLVVDLTFEEALSGELQEAFCERLEPMSEEEADDSGDDGKARFKALLEEVERAADWIHEEEFDSGPGYGSTNRSYYCSTPERLQGAFDAFVAANQQGAANPQGLGDPGPSHPPAPWQASCAIAVATAKLRGLSVDDVVDLLLREPGARQVLDQRPAVVTVKFEDGSGVEIRSGGLALLAPRGRA